MSIPKTLSRLQPGMIIRLLEGLFRVDMVNESRARCVPAHRTPVTIQTPLTGTTRSFTVPGDAISISPNSEVEIILHRSSARPQEPVPATTQTTLPLDAT